MTRDAFKLIVTEALDAAMISAEKRLGAALPRRFVLGWHGKPPFDTDEDVVGQITRRVFFSETEILPCADLFFEYILPDGRVFVVCATAGYPACPYGEHWHYKVPGHDAGRVGPFKLSCNALVQSLTAARPAD